MPHHLVCVETFTLPYLTLLLRSTLSSITCTFTDGVGTGLKERKKTENPREGWEDGTPPPHRDFLRRGECGASRRPPLGVCLFLSLFAVCRRFSLPPLCRPAVFLPSSFSLLSLLPLSRRSPLPRSAAPPPPVGPLLSRLLLPLGAVASSALLAAYCGPSSLSSSPLARTTLLTPTPIICRHVKLLLRSTVHARKF